jgi:hypothetical protein
VATALAAAKAAAAAAASDAKSLHVRVHALESDVSNARRDANDARSQLAAAERGKAQIVVCIAFFVDARVGKRCFIRETRCK